MICTDYILLRPIDLFFIAKSKNETRKNRTYITEYQSHSVHPMKFYRTAGEIINNGVKTCKHQGKPNLKIVKMCAFEKSFHSFKNTKIYGSFLKWKAFSTLSASVTEKILTFATYGNCC